jgi:hypothetical protein
MIVLFDPDRLNRFCGWLAIAMQHNLVLQKGITGFGRVPVQLVCVFLKVRCRDERAKFWPHWIGKYGIG